MKAVRTTTGRLKRRASVIAALVSTSILAGCVVGPDYQRPSTLLPATWANDKDRALARPPELSQWWTKLNDQLLTGLVERSIKGNLTVAVATARVEEARASLRQEVGGLFPTAGNASSVQRTRTAGDSARGAAAAVFTQYRSGFDASWELDLFGGKMRSVEAASYGLDEAGEELRNTMLVLIGDVTLNYAQLRANQALLALSQRTAKTQRDTAALTKLKREAGSATSADVDRAEALAATTEADIPAFEIARAAALHRLSVLLGLAPSQLSSELSAAGPIPRPRLPLPVGIPADTLLSRPDVRVAELQLAQATARIGVAEAARYPSVSLTGNIASNALQLSELAQKSTIAWAIGPAITIPIFRGGQLTAAVDVASARKDQAFATYNSTVLTAMEDVENAIVALGQQRVRNNRLASAASAYRRAVDSSRTEFEEGAAAYIDLLDAQRQLYTSEAALINSQLDIARAYIALNKALGGGWSGVDSVGAEMAKKETTPQVRQAAPVRGVSHR